MRGDSSEYDALEAFGNEGWNWDSLFPYFKRSEHFTDPTEAQAAVGASHDPQVHGYDGPLDISFQFGLVNGTFYEKIQAGWETLGYHVNPDVNSGDVRGFSVFPQTVDRDANVREDAARAYWHPVEDRPNLSIIRGTVHKVTWANSLKDEKVVAEGLEYVNQDNETVIIKASKEVILSAGSLRTPLILELSGVGNPR